ncbi:acetyl-CoA carboxylase biotin carboxyl carrier protein [Longimicrobium sp.]|uniref:acetyl-CoA carboxylase biotin carboxyl carrier protein n=1 Tax=Longimicrobium sp. TaxID=2029185 RepID=UPI0032C248BF
MELDFLRGLIEAVDGSGIDSLEISRGGTRIRINKTPPPAPVSAAMAAPALQAAPAVQHALPAAAAAAAPAPAAESAAPAAAASSLVEIKSPMVGTFYRSPAPEAPSYVETGTRVSKGQTLCILEAMKLMNELPADVAGTIREICVENGEPVEYGQVLFRIDPA